MVNLGPNSYPQWRRGSVPSVEEWQLLFSKKLDGDRVMEELARALQSATPQQVAALLNILVPAVTGKITNDGSIITNDTLEKKLSNYQPAGDYQPAGNYQQAGNYQVAGDYATNASLQQETQRAEAAEAAIFQLPAWVPLPCPFTTAPSGFIAADGRSFNMAACPQLAAAFPSGNVPDLRGLFIRGLDTSRTIDNYPGGRTVLSYEDGSTLFGVVGNRDGACAWYDGNNPTPFNINTWAQMFGWDTSSNLASPTAEWRESSGSDGTANQSKGPVLYGVARPKNSAWNYVFKAA